MTARPEFMLARPDRVLRNAEFPTERRVVVDGLNGRQT
jgi:hypothetical protein